MRKYETIIVFHPELSKESLEKEVEKVSELLKNNGAEFVEPLHWGRKQIAYLAKKQTHGHYVCFQYQTNNSAIVDEAITVFRIQDNILKFQTHRVNESRRKFQGNPKRLKGAQAAA